MNNTNSNLPDDLDLEGDLKDALTATFGGDAVSWLQDDDSGMDADFAAAAAKAMLAEDNVVRRLEASAENPLSELLDSTQSSCWLQDAAVAPALMQQAGWRCSRTNVTVDQGPRHVVFPGRRSDIWIAAGRRSRD